jgi:hypothetical protein
MDVVVYIHGVVARRYGPHTDEYRALRDGVTGRGVELPALESSVLVEWGWPTPEAEQTAGLAVAQANLGTVLEGSPAGDSLTYPLIRPLRELTQYGWSDVVFYVVPEGRTRARRAVWCRILDQVPTDRQVDLTFISHSAGSLLAHDLLFYLYSGERTRSRTQYAPSREWAAAQSSWRVRRFVTLGSALAPLMVRSVELVDRLATGPAPWLELDELGFGLRSYSGHHPMWLNLWDRHDIFSFPVAGLYREQAQVLDVYADHSDWPPRAHQAYWGSPKVHQALATHWNAQP